MGRLEVMFRLGLTHPVSIEGPPPQSPAQITFTETGNTVRIEVPRWSAVENQERRGAMASLVLHVERQCSDEEGQDPTFNNYRRLNIPQDAARAFWMLFDTLRYVEFHRKGFLPGYPVAPSEEIQENPLVRTCEAEWVYEAKDMQSGSFGGIATIGLDDETWREAANRLSTGTKLPPYISFALDAAYFLKGDPVRAVIMVCAAWETALRYYVANVALTPANDNSNLPQLRQIAERARGGPLFYDAVVDEFSESVESQRKHIEELPRWRNKLVHEGRNLIPKGEAESSVLAVLRAIDWLFQ